MADDDNDNQNVRVYPNAAEYWNRRIWVPASTFTTGRNFTEISSEIFFSMKFLQGRIFIEKILTNSHQKKLNKFTLNFFLIILGTNSIAVKVENYDSWAFFDLQLVAYYEGGSSTGSASTTGSDTTSNGSTTGNAIVCTFGGN